MLDPSQALRGKRDIGIRYGLIEALERDIPAARALRVLDAGGKLVTPGLIDLHCHVYPYGSAIGIPADELVAHPGTTTCVSAGDAGANNFAAFRRYIVAQTRTRLYAFVHIANIGLAGFPVPELYNIDFAQVDAAAARAVAENADMVLGVKVRMSENVIAKHGLEPLKRAITACEIRRRRQGHVPYRRRGDARADVADPRPAAPRRHPHPCYSGRAQHRRRLHQHRAGRQALPAALAAKQRGVIFDVGHGGGSFDYTSPSRRSRRAARPTPSPPTSTCSPATRPACRTSPG